MGILALAFVAVMAVLGANSHTLPSPSINHADWTTLMGLPSAIGLYEACVASFLDTCVSNPQESQSTPSVPPANQSALFNVLHDLGYNDTCVASALDACEGVSKEDQLETFLKEGRGLLQEGRDFLQEGRNLLQETKDLQQKGKDLPQQGRDLLQETREVLQEDKALHQTTLELLQETRDLLDTSSHPTSKRRIQPLHCRDLLDAGDSESGVRLIHPYPSEPGRTLRVYCDQQTTGGGWTVFQRRTNASVRENFYRGFHDYRKGFGNLEEEFWLGLDALHILTSTVQQELRINLVDWEEGYAHARYRTFHVARPTDKYRLTVGGYSGTAEDSLEYHSGQQFSTFDSDSDDWGYNCAAEYRGAWWYDDCAYSNLNGYQYAYNPIEYNKGIVWSHWHGYYYSLRGTVMMMRPR